MSPANRLRRRRLNRLVRRARHSTARLIGSRFSSEPSVPKGILLVLTAVIFFCVTDLLAKYLTRFYPVTLIVWARFTFHMVLVVSVLGPRLRMGLVRTRRLAEQILRGLLLMLGALFFIGALKYLPLAEATAIAYLSPLFVTLLSVVCLKETVEPARWIAILCSFGGVLIIIRPGSHFFSWAALLPVANALAFATYQIVTRRLAGMESPYTSIFYAGLVGTVVLSAIVPDVWMLPQSVWHAIAFIVLGVLGALGHLILIRAYDHAPASRVAPFSYSQLVWVAIIGYFAFGDFPDAWSLFGMGVIIASGVFMATRRSRDARPDEIPLDDSPMTRS
ncbi:MAG: DMT family transporter [Candidatus Accumulibacter sp.]|jgi:drug/metabolite transporter (DMT)-like permease|nr:DMT family transporter [Accumulibacter sp.]